MLYPLDIIIELDFITLVTLYVNSFNQLLDSSYSLGIVVIAIACIVFGIMYFISELIISKRKLWLV